MAKLAAKTGRPPLKIDWNEFDKLASYQCTQGEIADFFACSIDGLENACRRDKDMSLSAYWSQKQGMGRTKLKKIQFRIADEGNASMAIFLGKQMLGQTDKPVDEAILDTIQKAGLTKDQAIKILIEQASTKAATTGKKSFEDFCETAGYPRPFAKQIEMMEFGINETDTRLLLGARGYGKTDYVVICGLAYDIYVHPMQSTNLIMTKSRERNASMLAEIAHALKANGIVLEIENSQALRVAGLHGKDHSISAVTVKTQTLRGRHPKRVIMDDPVTEDDTSDATRLLVKKKYNELMKLCSNVLVIGQPAHKFDLYAELRGLLKKMEVVHGQIPELDHDLEAQRLAGVDEASIQASYFLKILDEGANPFDKIRYCDEFPTGDSAVAFIDPSHEGGDYTALAIVKAYMQGVAVVGFTYKKAWNHCLTEMGAQLLKYNVKKLCFETNALGDMPLDILRQVYPTIGVMGKRANNNKHSRIMAAGAFAQLIHLSKQSDKQFIHQVVTYEYKAKFDDAPDALASCLEWIGLTRGTR